MGVGSWSIRALEITWLHRGWAVVRMTTNSAAAGRADTGCLGTVIGGSILKRMVPVGHRML